MYAEFMNCKKTKRYSKISGGVIMPRTEVGRITYVRTSLNTHLYMTLKETEFRREMGTYLSKLCERVSLCVCMCQCVLLEEYAT